MNVRDRAAELVAGGLAALEEERGHINDLNVYPVPDGDTGTNMALTTRSVLEAVEATAGGELAEVGVLGRGAEREDDGVGGRGPVAARAAGGGAEDGRKGGGGNERGRRFRPNTAKVPHGGGF